MKPAFAANTNTIMILLLGLSLVSVYELEGQTIAINSIEDMEVLEIMIEDATSELARNQASLQEVRSIYAGLEIETARDQELRLKVKEHITYYRDLIDHQQSHLARLRDQRKKLEKIELDKLRNLQNFSSPYEDNRRTAFLDLILKPRSSSARFGDSGQSRMDDLDAELFAALGGLQNRLNQETQNRQEASYILLDREASANTIVEMQKVSQGYYDERFVLYDKMNQTYEQILRWRPDLAIFFRPPPEPKAPEAYKRALERIQANEPVPGALPNN